MKTQLYSPVTPFARLVTLVLFVCFLVLQPAQDVVQAARNDLSGPAGSGKFGADVYALPNGNFVVTDPEYGPVAGDHFGAVYLYNGDTRELISRITGTTTDDMVGSGGIKILKDGSFVVVSPRWNNGSALMAGAVTWCSASAGCPETVTASNSLVGSKTNDYVGAAWAVQPETFKDSNGITPVSGGAYLVRSVLWGNYKGAVTYCASGSDANCLGAVSSANSLVGSTSPNGTSIGDYIGNNVTLIPSGGYVVNSSYWTNGSFPGAGVVVPCPAVGCKGVVSTSNSLYGSAAYEAIGTGIFPLPNGGFVVQSYMWGYAYSGLGAVTYCASVTDPNCIGKPVSSENSLTGKTTVNNTMIGSHGITVLPDGSYLIKSPSWKNDALVRVGALTLCTVSDGGSSCTGKNVTTANSLTGDTDQDNVGSGVVLLSGGAFLVTNAQWHNWTGAVTYCASAAGCAGQTVSSANSLVGGNSGVSWSNSTGGDMLGSNGSLALSNGAYVVFSYNWDPIGSDDQKGAATFCPAAGCFGAVTLANSLTGSKAGDQVGMGGGLELASGAVIVSSPNWSDGTHPWVGAITFCGSAAECQGSTVEPSNSLVGDQDNAQIGYYSNFALPNGAYLVGSSNWANGDAEIAGALTWCPASGCKGMTVDAANSLVGSHAYDYVGSYAVVLEDDLYVTPASGWQNGTLQSAGAVTLCSQSAGCTGPVTAENSVLGAVQGFYYEEWDYYDSLHSFQYDPTHHRLLVGMPMENKVVFFTLSNPVVTGGASSITANGATLNGTVNAGDVGTTVTFEYGLTTGYGATVTAAQSPVSGTSDTPVSADISDLTPNTLYHYQVVAENANGTVRGGDQTFTTNAAAPVVTTDAASMGGGVRLNGTVNANNASTTVTFEYGLTTGYGRTVTAEQSPVNGTSNTPVSAWASGLTPNTLYHFRVTGTNAGGTTNGLDQTFTTTAEAPLAITYPAGSVTATGAILHGLVNANNSSTTVTFVYGLTTAYGFTIAADQSPVSGMDNTPVSAAISGLLPNTLYHFKIAATNEAGIANAKDHTFTTSLAAPVLTVDAPGSITATAATLNGTVNAQNASTTVTFEYGLTTSYGTTVPADQSPVTGASDTPVSFTVSDLSPHTLYHFRMVATSAGGTTVGEDQNFTTSAAAPSVTTDAASGVTGFEATLNGTVNALNAGTTVTFEYGPTTAYGATVMAGQSPVTGSVNTPVSYALSELTPNTLYHFRVSGTNAGGTTNGLDQTFTTSKEAPIVATDSASEVTGFSATLNGTVNALNDSTTVTFEYGLTTGYGLTVTADQSPVSGASYTAVSAAITGLTPGVLYHFRAVGTSDGGTTLGSDQIFTAGAVYYTISGNVGMAGATLSYVNGTPVTATADSSGDYSFTVPHNWSGTVTPFSEGYTFTPASRTYTNVTAAQTAQDYTPEAITYTISGNAGLAGAVLSYTDGEVKTVTADSSGNYSFTVSYKWSGTVTPSRTAYSFSPASRTYTSLTADQDDENYTANYNPPLIQPASEIKIQQFTANWNSCSEATGYYLDVATDANFTQFVPGYENLDAGNVTSLTITGLKDHTTYYYRVRSYNADSVSSHSETSEAATPWVLIFAFLAK